MANTEDALEGLEQLLEEDYPTYLRAVEQMYTDGVELENIREISWEEYDDGVGLQIPGVMLLPEEERDNSLRDILFDCQVTMILVVADSSKRNVTKKMFRYGRALRRMLKPVRNRTLRGRVVSAKVMAIRWQPTRRGTTPTTTNLFARGFEADLVLRVPKEEE